MEQNGRGWMCGASARKGQKHNKPPLAGRSDRMGLSIFPGEQSVNAALRTLIHVAKGRLRRAR